MLRNLNRIVFNSRKCISSYFRPKNLNFSVITQPSYQFSRFARKTNRTTTSFSENNSRIRSLCTKEPDSEDEIESETYFDIEGIDVVETSEQTYLEQMKNLLFSNIENDELLCSISNCQSVDQIYQILEQNLEHFTTKHTVQTVLLYWALSKQESSSEPTLQPEKPIVQQLFDKISDLTEAMDPDEMTCCLMYLHKCGRYLIFSVFLHPLMTLSKNFRY